ncbi:MAG: hypothetical protein CM15mP21_8180 [Hyphomicrobiales bacterium]|nr:MAG: hypothetical protein CM15mP21_8180 [Hyphomicrobiales bacterium]
MQGFAVSFVAVYPVDLKNVSNCGTTLELEHFAQFRVDLASQNGGKIVGLLRRAKIQKHNFKGRTSENLMPSPSALSHRGG